MHPGTIIIIGEDKRCNQEKSLLFSTGFAKMNLKIDNLFYPLLDVKSMLQVDKCAILNKVCINFLP